MRSHIAYARGMKRLRQVLLLLAVGLIGYGIAWVQPYVVRPPLIVGQDAISDAASLQARVQLDDVDGRVLSIRPASSEGDVLLVFYPGGLVRPQAYEWLGRELAVHGVHTVIPEFAADLAVTGKDRAEPLIQRYAAGRPVVLAGHSLGGVMAADFVSRHADQVAGLVLMAAYPADGIDLSGTGFGALSLLAEHDGNADAGLIRASLPRLGPGSRLAVIPGAVHSFFGRYGPQDGDGTPTVSRAQAEKSIVAELVGYLDPLS